jgi:hypothetical protein
MDSREIEITYVVREGGKRLMLTDYPCDHCGKIGSPYLAVGNDDGWAFCSGECRDAALRCDGQPLTPELMEKAGLHYIGPKPDA